MSMKNATLVLACGTPLVALMLARLPSGRNASHATFRLAAIALLLLGLLNTAGYLVATPLTRAGLPLQPVIALHADYIAALHHVRATTPRSAVVLDPAAAESADSNPAVIFAARRVILPSLYDLTWGFTNDEVVRRGRAWAQWQQSGFTDESCASALAACADCLVVSATLASSHWRHDARFGGIHVYRSRSRSTLGAAAALPGQTVMRGTPLGAGSPREPWSAPPPTHSSSRNG